MAHVYLALGSNLGNKEQQLNAAVQAINTQIGKVTSLSAFYATAPWGFCSGNPFLNAALCVHTSLSPQEVLHRTQDIESALGRTSKSHGGIYHDRPIDIDLLLYDDCVLNTSSLTLPHPGIASRLFVLEPLAEIAPALVHPLLHQPMRYLLDSLRSHETPVPAAG